MSMKCPNPSCDRNDMRVEQTRNVGVEVYRTRICRDDACRWRVTTIERYAEQQLIPIKIRSSRRNNK